MKSNSIRGNYENGIWQFVVYDKKSSNFEGTAERVRELGHS